MKKFYTIVLGIIVSLSAVSCLEEKQEPWTPGPQEDANNYGVFFPVQDASGAHTYDPDMATNVKITVSRTNTSGAIEVPFTSSVSEEGIFNFGTINFADGQSETTLTVNFPTAKQGTTYSFSIQIDPAYSSSTTAATSHWISQSLSLPGSTSSTPRPERRPSLPSIRHTGEKPHMLT